MINGKVDHRELLGVFQVLGAWIWMDRGKERKYGMEAMDFTTPSTVSIILPCLYPEVKTDFSILEKENRMGN